MAPHKRIRITPVPFAIEIESDVLRHQGRDDHRIDVGFLKIDQRARAAKDAAGWDDQSAGEPKVAQLPRPFFVEIKIIGRPAFRSDARIPRARSLGAFAGNFLWFGLWIVRILIDADRLWLECLRQSQSAVGIDEAGINRLPGQVPDACFRRNFYIGTHLDD